MTPVARALKKHGLDGIVCAVPGSVLMLTGYCPVVGNSLAAATANGEVLIVVPDDELKFAQLSSPAPAIAYSPGSLDTMQSVHERLITPLRAALSQLGLESATVAYEAGYSSHGSVYAACHQLQPLLPVLLPEAAPRATFVAAVDVLAEMRSMKTPKDVQSITSACRVAQQAFEQGSAQLVAGMLETEAALNFRNELSVGGMKVQDALLADGFVYCMSGIRSAEAFGAFARSNNKEMQRGDLVLVHCNSHVNGYWTDITRTYCLGSPSARVSEMYAAVMQAREAALKTIAPGVRAADVDAAARAELERAGFGPNFKHSTGHGVGFKAFDPNSRPRLHPKSPDIIEAGMVFNVEPAIYIDGFGGMRHCDMAAVTADGNVLLTPFHSSIDELCIAGR